MFSVAAVTLALFSVCATATPAIDSRASELSCASVPSTNGSLRIYSTAQDANATLPSDGVSLGIGPVNDANKDPLLQSYNGISWHFIFYQCNSTYMGYTEITHEDAHTYYGQVRVTNDNGDTDSCLTVSSGQSLVSLQNCSSADDASQTTQFWELMQNGTSLAPAPLTFLGNLTYTSHPQFRPGYYATDFPYLGGNQVVTAVFYDALNSRTDYQIKLLYDE
jgi:hypothetical protein